MAKPNSVTTNLNSTTQQVLCGSDDSSRVRRRSFATFDLDVRRMGMTRAQGGRGSKDEVLAPWVVSPVAAPPIWTREPLLHSFISHSRPAPPTHAPSGVRFPPRLPLPTEISKFPSNPSALRLPAPPPALPCPSAPPRASPSPSRRRFLCPGHALLPVPRAYGLRRRRQRPPSQAPRFGRHRPFQRPHLQATPPRHRRQRRPQRRRSGPRPRQGTHSPSKP